MKAPAALAAMSVLAACAPPFRQGGPPEPVDPAYGAIVLALTLGGGRFQRFPAYVAAFSRVGPDGGLDEGRLDSNFRSGDRVYLLGVPAGRYALVEVSYRHMGHQRVVGLKPVESRRWAVDVGHGQVAFMGRHLFKTGSGFRPSAGLREVDVSSESEIEALEAAAEDLSGTLWEDAVSRRLSELGPSGRPIKVGKREIPRQTHGPFSFVDIIGWGAPRRIAGGLEWREALDRARVAAVYLSTGTRGWKPPEEYLRHLRGVGGPEDDHRVAEVVFSSRTAYRARYTTYVYPEGLLEGEGVKSYRTETLVVPDGRNLFVLHYRAEKALFERFHKVYLRFRRTFRLGPKPAG